MSVRFGKSRRRHRHRVSQCTGQWKLAAAERLEARHLLAGDVLIAEFTASNKTGLLDSFGETSDWIEVYNGTSGGEPILDSVYDNTEMERQGDSIWRLPP